MKMPYTEQVEDDLILHLNCWRELNFSYYEARTAASRLSYKMIVPVLNEITPAHNLERLSCQDVDLGEKGYKHVLHLILTVPSLNQINVMGTDLTVDQKKNIFRAMEGKQEQRQLVIPDAFVRRVDELEANVRKESRKVRQLIQAVNELNISRKEHHNNKVLKKLSNDIERDLRTHCEEIIPLASGKYKPEHNSTTSLHAIHEAAHTGEHIAHAIKIGANMASHLSCITSAVAKVIEIKIDHSLIHGARHLVNQLSKYEVAQRGHIYKYVILSTLLELSTRIDVDGGNSVSLSHNDESTSNILLGQWWLVILSESIACLAELLDTAQDINAFAQQWGQAITQKFIPQQIAYRPLQGEELSIDWSIALKIQRIFTGPRQPRQFINPKPVYLPKPEPTNFLDDFHKGLYEVLKSREWPANSDYYACSFLFGGYKREHLQTLQEYHFNFKQSLEIINTELRSLSDTDISYTPQLKLINACLRANLKEMAKAMPWHKLAVKLSNEQVSSGFDAILEPLRKAKDGTLQIAENFQKNVQESMELFQSDEQQLCSIRKRSIC